MKWQCDSSLHWTVLSSALSPHLVWASNRALWMLQWLPKTYFNYLFLWNNSGNLKLPFYLSPGNFVRKGVEMIGLWSTWGQLWLGNLLLSGFFTHASCLGSPLLSCPFFSLFPLFSLSSFLPHFHSEIYQIPGLSLLLEPLRAWQFLKST